MPMLRRSKKAKLGQLPCLLAFTSDCVIYCPGKVADSQ